MDALWEAASAVTSELALGETEKADMARVVAMKRPAVALAELPSEEQAALSRLLQRVSETAIAIVNRQKVAVQRLSVKRFLRVVSAFVVVVGLVFALIAMIPKPRPPAGSDLAKTAAWTTSSKLADCDPVAGQCAGAKTKIFFHTNEDDSPWVEYDLGRPTEIKAIIVTNRQDGLPDRAVPLVAEVSDDQKTYRELGRQETTFTVWEPKFEKQKTRYVRLRVARKTYFHLEAVEIR